MKRILPHPVMTVALVIMWMILTRFTLGQLVLGTAVALVASKALAALEPQTVRVRRWRPIPGLIGVLVADLLWSNLTVARMILSADTPRSGVVEVELGTRNRNVLAILSIIVSTTPGTAWLGWDPRSGTLLMHVLDLGEEGIWKTAIQDRYECRLREIFE